METPKQKAKEFVEKMYYCQKYVDGENYIPLEAYKRAKQCALVNVKEIIKSNPLEPTYIYNDGKIKYELHSQHYWQQVKTEIEVDNDFNVITIK